MRIESIGSGSYVLFLSNGYIGSIDYDSKEEIGLYLKKIIILLKESYNIVLNGFYCVNIYINDKLGMFIEIDNIEGYDSIDLDVDLKITVHYDSDVYFKTLNFDIVSRYDGVRFLDGNYYVNIDNVEVFDIMKIIEFGEFVYGDECDNINNFSSIVNK